MRGAWRKNEPVPDICPEELDRALDCIVSMGAAPLIWPRIRHVLDSAHTRPAEALRAAYHETVLDNKRFRPQLLAALASILEQGGIEPLTFKGWSLAQYYHPPALRPLGDIDICVPAGRYADAVKLIATHTGQSPSSQPDESTSLTLKDPRTGRLGVVDLQVDLARFRLEPLAEVFERSQKIQVSGRTLRIPCPEDHLRLLCLHFLGHGGCRPVWLCDVAAMLEAETDGFDWNLCLGDDPLTTHWIGLVILLAHTLLGAKIDSVPEQYRKTKLPTWLVPMIFRQWSKPLSEHRAPEVFSHVLRRTPNKIGPAVFARWPDPITARFQAGAWYDERPRWPYQMAYFFRKGAAFAGKTFQSLDK